MVIDHATASNVSTRVTFDPEQTILDLRCPIGAQMVARLDLLENRERILSTERQLIHTQIDDLRCMIGLLPSSDTYRIGRLQLRRADFFAGPVEAW